MGGAPLGGALARARRGGYFFASLSGARNHLAHVLTPGKSRHDNGGSQREFVWGASPGGACPLHRARTPRRGIMADFQSAYSVQTVVRNEFTGMLEAHVAY
jgi:hypothetical protein